MRHLLTLLFCVLCCAAQGRTIFVATDGDDNAAGAIDSPWASIHKAVDEAQPGDIIYMRGGTYMLTRRIKIPAKATSAAARICLFAYNDEPVIIDGSGIVTNSEIDFKQARCIYVNHEANYWHFRGLTLCNAKDNGMKIEGSYNIVERCVFHDNNDTGLQIGMYKDFTIEETKSLPAGTPQYNPDYRYCRGNKIINCDSYYNCDRTLYGGGADDMGDADGFACKLFPGPGNEFYGCRAWSNSDDNWDLYMVYFPVRIDHCWAWRAGYTKEGTEGKNGNGFKLGGGGSAGGAAFSQSTGAHVVTNCVSFNNLHKGFDQNNAYEGMYIVNCTAWGNEYNYRFPTVFEYGGMVLRNNIGFNATKENHEFLSGDKAGVQVPNTDYNSWTTLDQCSPYKESTKVGKTANHTRDYTAQFRSLSEADASAPRGADGELPDNGFARLVDNSVFKDLGQVFDDFVPTRFMTEAQATAAGLELVTADPITIPYNDAAPDFGAYESGTPTQATLKVVTGATQQTVYTGDAIEPVTLRWGQAATDVDIAGLPATITATRDTSAKTVTIAGTLTADATITISTRGGENTATATIALTVSTERAATLICTTANAVQTVDRGDAIRPITFQRGGGATDIDITTLPAGLKATKDGDCLTISGTPTEEGTYNITTIGGRDPQTIGGKITLVAPTRVLTGDWYHMQDALDQLPDDLKGVVDITGCAPDAWSPERTETDGSVPAGCTAGGVDLLKEGGTITWTLPSLSELKINLHFTGGRTFTIKWQTEGEAEQTFSTGKLSKATKTGYDLMATAGIPQTQKPITVSFVNAVGSGGARVYDFFVRVFRTETQAIRGIADTGTARPVVKRIAGNQIVIGNHNALGQQMK